MGRLLAGTLRRMKAHLDNANVDITQPGRLFQLSPIVLVKSSRGKHGLEGLEGRGKPARQA